MTRRPCGRPLDSARTNSSVAIELPTVSVVASSGLTPHGPDTKPSGARSRKTDRILWLSAAGVGRAKIHGDVR